MSFRAKTSQGYVIKVLSELLSNNIKVGCFVLRKEGITFRMSDTHHQLCIDIELLAENFELFNVNFTNAVDNQILIGINLSHLRKMLKPVKKKESIEISKETHNTDELCIKISPKELGGKTTISYIKIQEIQAIDMTLPEGYEHYVSIPASDYQKMCKDMDSISQEILIESTKSMIRFTSDVSGIYSRSIAFGVSNEDDEIEYCHHFDTEQLNNLGRLSGIGASSANNIQVYSKRDLPILFKTSVGTLGKIKIYIKSKEQVENDNQTS